MITTNLITGTLIYRYLIMFFTASQTLAFMPISKNPKTHQDITRDAILQTTAEICQSRALQKDLNFVQPEALSAKSVAGSCYSTESTKDFQRSLDVIVLFNAWIDIKYALTGSYHFDNEEFSAGRNLITKGVSAVKYSIKQQSYQAAREELGKLSHTLQDFYSHSNWIELGKKVPYSNLIKPNTPLDNIADSDTCRNCDSDVCSGNILEEVITQQKLTSGYFGFFKPNGKCSHGGQLDFASNGKGGINKDTTTSSHGHLHEIAASVATAATKELLQDIRASVGDSEFLRMLGLSQSLVLCFVIDTSSSMSETIAEVRRIASSIIDSKTGTATQSSEYILVPFNDPDFGPLTRVTDPNVFKQQLSALTAAGGGDSPEMCLSGLQLALTGSPPQTEIFVFTDADAKDKVLKNTVRALIERTKSVVTFMLTNTISSRRRRRSADGQSQISPQLFNSQVYQDLAQASGGQAIEVTKETLPQATNIIAVTSTSTLVTLFQAVRNPAKAENFSVLVDTSVQNLTIYITGNSPLYNITSPSGVTQSSAVLNGSLGLIQKVGNFHTVLPNIAGQAGLWLLSINSTQPYTIRVVGQSDVDFLFDFVERSQGPITNYAKLNSRPAANTNVTLLVTMVGGDTVNPTEVSLVKASSSDSFNGIIENVASGQYVVTFKSIPAGEFTVRVVGLQFSSSTSSNYTFQRQSPTQFQTSTVNITTQPVGTVEPGKQFTIPFTLATNDSGGNFNISVFNDRNFDTRFNTSITLESGGSANDTVTLTVPANTSSGTDVTVTITAEAPNGSDFNYIVLRTAIVAPVRDIFPPVCETVIVNADCTGNCSLSSWYLTANVTDGSGIQSVRVLQGKGTLTTSSIVNAVGVNVTMAFYNASCCFQNLELVAVDTVGNVATCYKSTAAPNILTYGAELLLFLPVCLWFNIGVSIYQFMQL